MTYINLAFFCFENFSLTFFSHFDILGFSTLYFTTLKCDYGKRRELTPIVSAIKARVTAQYDKRKGVVQKSLGVLLGIYSISF